MRHRHPRQYLWPAKSHTTVRLRWQLPNLLWTIGPSCQVEIVWLVRRNLMGQGSEANTETGHIYCRRCLEGLLVQGVGAFRTCPSCRRPCCSRTNCKDPTCLRDVRCIDVGRLVDTVIWMPNGRPRKARGPNRITLMMYVCIYLPFFLSYNSRAYYSSVVLACWLYGLVARFLWAPT